VTVFKNY